MTPQEKDRRALALAQLLCDEPDELLMMAWFMAATVAQRHPTN